MKIEDLPDEVMEEIKGWEGIFPGPAEVAHVIDVYLKATQYERPCAFCQVPTRIIDNRRYHIGDDGHYWPCAGRRWRVAA